MSVLSTGKFWIATAERAVKTAGQTAVAFLTADVTGILEVDPVQAASVVGLAVVVSVATSLGSIPVSGEGPSAVRAETLSGPRNTHRADH